MIPETRAAIYNVGKNITGLTGGFFYLIAPSLTVSPYAVFSQISNPFTQDTVNDFEDVYFQINIYSLSAAEAGTLFEAAKKLFDNAEAQLTTVNYSAIRIQRQLTRESVLDKTFMNTIQYRLQLQKK